MMRSFGVLGAARRDTAFWFACALAVSGCGDSATFGSSRAQKQDAPPASAAAKPGGDGALQGGGPKKIAADAQMSTEPHQISGSTEPLETSSSGASALSQGTASPNTSALPSLEPATTVSPLPAACRADLAKRFAGFSIKGGQSLAVSNTFSEYPGLAALVTFAASSPVRYSGGSFVAQSGVATASQQPFSVSLPAVPECQGTFTIMLMPDNTFVSAEAAERGLKGSLYRLPSSTKALPDFSKISPIGTVFISELDVPTRSFTSGFPGVATNLIEWFAIDFSGHLIIEKSGSYQFMVVSDDGSIVYLNNSVLINNDGTHSTLPAWSATVQLAAGAHPLRVSYFQGPRHHIALQLFYKGPDSPEWKIVPQSMLRVTP